MVNWFQRYKNQFTASEHFFFFFASVPKEWYAQLSLLLFLCLVHPLVRSKWVKYRRTGGGTKPNLSATKSLWCCLGERHLGYSLLHGPRCGNICPDWACLPLPLPCQLEQGVLQTFSGRDQVVNIFGTKGQETVLRMLSRCLGNEIQNTFACFYWWNSQHDHNWAQLFSHLGLPRRRMEFFGGRG